MQGLELTYETLATTRNEAAVDVLIAALDDPNAANRRRALGALLSRTEPRSSQQVLENWDKFMSGPRGTEYFEKFWRPKLRDFSSQSSSESDSDERKVS